MKKTKNIKFETIENRKIREKNDKKYRHARQHAKVLRKNDTSSNSLSATFSASTFVLTFFVSTSILTFSACRQCDFCQKYKDLFQFLFSDFNEKFRSMCLYCFIDDINNLNKIE